MKTTPLYPLHKQLGATFEKKHLEWNIATEFTDTLSEHHAVRKGVGITDVSYRGRHRLTGEDRAKFLHRIISNDVETLTAGQGTYATILTHRGKIIADMHISVLADAIQIDTAPETTRTLFEELDKYIIADDVELVDATTEMGAIGVHGPQSTELVHAVFSIYGDINGLSTLPERHHIFREADTALKHAIHCVRSSDTGEVGWTLYTAAEALPPLYETLLAEGARFDAQPVGWNALESLRIEAGVPRYGAELTEAVIPLEAELEHAIDFEKGCYIGQEIVARMKYRGHPNRLLRGIDIDGDLPSQQGHHSDLIGARVLNEGKAVGWITSATFAPTLGKSIALAYVRMAVTEPGSRIDIETSTGALSGRVVLLPFL